ncbi:Lsa36 family surface (lipo)protein [Leptospira sp. 'Mane']|uniref:Lsa36 family surface (lipo)protein n=1 Tax=Leptospira sp. 'Mane' TaxID=3387407 RepID=UPI00398A7C27
MKQTGFIFLFLFGIFLGTQSLQAQFTCEGKACSYLPSNLTSLTNDTYYRFQKDYLNEVMKTNTEAGFLANLGGSVVGTGHVRRFQIGAGISAAGYKKDNISIGDTGFKLPELPNVGASVIPSINLDFNLGWVLGFDDQHYMRRFSVYLHGMNSAISQKQLESFSNNKNYEGRITIKSYGGMLRYQVFEKVGFFANVITWNGVNIGAGHHVMDENFSLSYLEGKAATIQTNGVKGKWGGDTNFDYHTKIRTTHADIRTGIGLFWFLNVIVGGGYSWNTGDSEMSLSRRGPYLVQTAAANIIELPREYQSQINPALLSASDSGTLGLNASGSASSRRKIGYGIVGLEIDVFLLKIIAEGIYGGKDLYSANLGVKLSF